MKLLFRIFRSVIYVPLFIFAFGWVALQVSAYDAGLGLSMPSWTRIPGIILMVAGSILVLICVATFVYIGKGTPAVFDPPKEFVATGPYAYVRNPMYLGGFILLAGFGLYQRSFSILFLLILFIFIFHLFVVVVEEPTLTEKFGESYLNYRKKVNRWIPKKIS